MKKELLALICFLFLSTAFAQSWQHNDLIRYKAGRNFHAKYANWQSWAEKDTFLELKLVYTRCYRYNAIRSRKKQEYTTIESYDQNGCKYNVKELSKKGKIKAEEVYRINDNDRITEDWIYVNGKRKYSIYFDYDSLKRIKNYAFYKKSRKMPETFEKYEYGGKKLLKKWIYKKDTVNYLFVCLYNYVNDTGALLSTRIEDAKGKPIFTWNYDCNKMGTLSKKEAKKETQICKSDQRLPSGNRQVVYIENIENETHRSIYEYDSLNRLISILNFRGKYGDKLSWKQVVERNGDSINQITEQYNEKNGRMMYHFETIKNSKGKVLYNVYESYKGKVKKFDSWETEYTYNGDLLVKSTESTLRHSKWTYVREYEYMMKH